MHIAIIGCGQLSRMLALAGIPLGFTFSFVADSREDIRCVEGLGTTVRWRPGESVQRLYQDLGKPERITVEKEQVDISLLNALQEYCVISPNLEAITTCGQRHREKRLLDKLGIASSPYTYGKSAADSAAILSLPMIAKSCNEGYDGKNQWMLTTSEEITSFDQQLDRRKHIIEQWIPFDKEVSQLSVRSQTGEIRHYPLTENQHKGGILQQSIAPATNIPTATIVLAQNRISQIMEALDYVGVMAMECFVVGEKLLVNELAPRVHNSGHWTQSGSTTCQFENHLRAIAGMTLGSTETHGVAGMLNLIGTDKPPLTLLSPRAKLHWYGKVIRPGRKLGHINLTGSSYQHLDGELQLFKKACEALITTRAE